MLRAATIHHLATVDKDGGGVNGVAFSPDGKTIAVASEGALLQMWDVASGQLLQTLADGKSFAMTSVAFSPDGKILAAGSEGSPSLQLWDAASGEVLQSIYLGD